MATVKKGVQREGERDRQRERETLLGHQNVAWIERQIEKDKRYFPNERNVPDNAFYIKCVMTILALLKNVYVSVPGRERNNTKMLSIWITQKLHLAFFFTWQLCVYLFSIKYNPCRDGQRRKKWHILHFQGGPCLRRGYVIVAVIVS